MLAHFSFLLLLFVILICIMQRRFLRGPIQSKFFRQYVATCLLLFFAWDIVLDSVPPLHAILDFSGGSVVSISSSAPGNPDTDHPDCGIPGHGCALSHHHHFPAILGFSNFTILVAAVCLLASNIVPSPGHVSPSSHPIRAPPFI